MALDTYTNLKTAVADWLNKASLTGVADRAEEFIALFEAQASRELDVREMIGATILTLSQETVGLPSDFAGVLSFRLAGDASEALTYVLPADLDGSSATGRPSRYTITDVIVLDPVPDAEYEARFRYRKRIPALGAARPTNWLLKRHPDAYLYGALSQALIYFRDDERQAIRDAYAAALEAIDQDDKRTAHPAKLNASGRPM